MATNEQDELEARKALYGLIDQAHIEVAVNAGLASYYIEQEIKSRLVSSIEAYVARHTKEAVDKGVRAKMVELRDQWGVWLDDSADDKQTIREIYNWLNLEIEFYDKEAALSLKVHKNGGGDDDELQTCKCGDYRRDHKNGTGACRMPDDLTHGFRPCTRFRPTISPNKEQKEKA